MKRLLYVHMDFYDYESRIIAALEKKGYEVTPFWDKNYRTVFSRSLNRIVRNSNYSDNKNLKYQEQFLQGFEDKKNQFDVVFVIVGRYLNKCFLEKLKQYNSSAKFILYLWDDISRVPHFFEQKGYYDVIYSIDKIDCMKYGLKFLPLFYTDDFIYDGRMKDILLFMSGIDHSNRVETIERIKQQAGKDSEKMLFYIFSSPMLQIQRWIKQGKINKKSKYIHYNRIGIDRVSEYTKRARCLLDIQYSEQNGLSLRTFECLGSKSKIITTNQSIIEYDFYNPNNIMVVDRKNTFQLDMDFVLSPYHEISSDIIGKYSIHEWSAQILQD